jgi:hypothetical protein
VCEVAGSGERGFNDDGLPAQETHLYRLTGRRGPDGLIYPMDFNNHRLSSAPTVWSTRLQAMASQFAVAGGRARTPLENPVDFDFPPDGGSRSSRTTTRACWSLATTDPRGPGRNRELRWWVTETAARRWPRDSSS